MESESAFIPQLVEKWSWCGFSHASLSPPTSSTGTEAKKITHNSVIPPSEGAQISDEELQKLFTDTFCNVCGAVLQFESQRISHYEGKKHAQKVKQYFQTRKCELETDAKKCESKNFQKDENVDKNRFCSLCNMVFSSVVVAQSHYSGKIHAKKLRKQGSTQSSASLATLTAIPHEGNSILSEIISISIPDSPATPMPEAPKEDIVSSPQEPRTEPMVSSADFNDYNKYCELCSASFYSPTMAQQHYSGKKHSRNAKRQKLLKDMGEKAVPSESETNTVGVGIFPCPICSITLNSIEVYQSHMQGNKHQLKESKVSNLIKDSKKKVYASFQEELSDYVQVQKARGLSPKNYVTKGNEKNETEEYDEECDKGITSYCSSSTFSPSGLFHQGDGNKKCRKLKVNQRCKIERSVDTVNFGFLPKDIRHGPCKSRGAFVFSPRNTFSTYPGFQDKYYGSPIPPSAQEKLSQTGESMEATLTKCSRFEHQNVYDPSAESLVTINPSFRKDSLNKPTTYFITNIYSSTQENILSSQPSFGIKPPRDVSKVNDSFILSQFLQSAKCPSTRESNGSCQGSSSDANDNCYYDQGRRSKRDFPESSKSENDSDTEEKTPQKKHKHNHSDSKRGGEVNGQKRDKSKHRKEKESRSKHRKDKKKKEEMDSRTEEEKLWDESIIGL
ncbi:zinc finger matrin-type protein 1 [Polypterus senegalus]|uniref:zinc finger matrin-type protein 1 n=1 Tax=Polypterus senegalus TaxID=55291 RepID=UPI00196680DD|nr:zinc finger matrin-type protein 1 [Polypterus senegalus]